MHIVQLKTTHTLIHGDSRKMAFLMKKGFQPAHADTYIVLHFDNTPIPFKKLPNLKEDKNTFRVKIRPLSDFL